MDRSQQDDPRRPEDPQHLPERTSGLTLNACYRHPDVMTGVHCTRCGRPICPDCMHEAAVGYQCPTCLAKARREGRRVRPLTLGRGRSLTSILLAVNVAVFAIELLLGAVGGLGRGGSTRRLVDMGAMVPILIAEGQYWRLLTAMFLHASLLHILFNMYALMLFGNVIESTLGTLRFAAIYVVSGFLAGVASFVFSNPFTAGVGASGAIFGLLGAWVAYNFRRRGTSFASANLRMAVIIVGLNLFLGFTIPQIDNSAHLGGLVAGAAAGWLAEGFGPRHLRTVIQGAGFAAMVAVGMAIVVARAGTLV